MSLKMVEVASLKIIFRLKRSRYFSICQVAETLERIIATILFQPIVRRTGCQICSYRSRRNPHHSMLLQQCPIKVLKLQIDTIAAFQRQSFTSLTTGFRLIALKKSEDILPPPSRKNNTVIQETTNPLPSPPTRLATRVGTTDFARFYILRGRRLCGHIAQMVGGCCSR